MYRRAIVLYRVPTGFGILEFYYNHEAENYVKVLEMNVLYENIFGFGENTSHTLSTHG